MVSPVQVLPPSPDSSVCIDDNLLPGIADPPTDPDHPPSAVNRSPLDELAEVAALSQFNRTISSGGYELDSMLQAIAESSQKLTRATGAAIAMWKAGTVVCRATCGDGAPPLGAYLSVESGISGHCLRSGLIQHCGETLNDPRVDADICRQLGLRSVVVLPIRGWRGVNGILEVFSTEPNSFAERDFALLEKLAALAERARAGQPELQSEAPQPVVEESPTPGLLPASDRLRDVATVIVGHKKSPLVLGAIAVAGLLLLGLVMWLGWRTPDTAKILVPPKNATTAPTATAQHDSVWKPNPGSESLLVSKPSPSFASKVVAKATTADSKTNSQKSSNDVAIPEVATKDVVVRYAAPTPASNTDHETIEPPTLTATSNPAAIDNVLSVSSKAPKLAALPISQGLTEGYPIHRVPPQYPAQAQATRLEGSVVMSAAISEDGKVQDLKVLEGNPTLARAALDAVRQWRYKPYELNKKPVKVNTTITVNFKLP